MKNCYLYRRYSTSKQSKGSSLERQQLLADRWCAANDGRLLDVITDEGYSAFKGDHISQGAFAGVLSAISSGQIPAGSYLLVENIDRLSRQAIGDALTTWMNILGADINIVTLMDGKIFTKESRNDLGSMLTYLVTQERAWSESHAKSVRTTNAIKAANKRLLNGEVARVTRPASWVTFTPSGYELNHKADAVRRLFELYLSGLGQASTAKQLNDEGITTLSGRSPKWSSASVRKVLLNENVTGIKNIDGNAVEVYPVVVTREDWLKAKNQLSSKSLGASITVGKVANPLTGFCHCGECSETMHYASSRSSAGVRYEYLQCASHRRLHKCGNVMFKLSHLFAVAKSLAAVLCDLPVEQDETQRLTAAVQDAALSLEDVRGRLATASDMAVKFPSEAAFSALSRLELEVTENTQHLEQAEIALASAKGVQAAPLIQLSAVRKLHLSDEASRREAAQIFRNSFESWVFNADGSSELLTKRHGVIYLDGAGRNLEIRAQSAAFEGIVSRFKAIPFEIGGKQGLITLDKA
ncbi:DNA invertase Pin-like site-specific DNA recombinase [Vibrio crassostreae]|uniref:recombinase family protein n=1 Tax=Vibrio crassostreae TaxID=246167 RepID=UPI000F461AC6|nr:recombinase family protein [Vibrio crassostreae]ROO70415.1 DNA invertase Pin-like site-specific DNA recombinase [Vibrio crassostreae]ROP08656.1 DNA invertase Pin-like site-specific DNA recombinase [Vibrio crassostreae]RPE91454.1 DNA invertase Pin-like site-specific DNA recombinase [Vibrio crassostreae]RPF14711.1 DNA invertase Pin-like site-specific DNA recombinase [Vibrio crassostreae]